jgi:hypothetical protein
MARHYYLFILTEVIHSQKGQCLLTHPICTMERINPSIYRDEFGYVSYFADCEISLDKPLYLLDNRFSTGKLAPNLIFKHLF